MMDKLKRRDFLKMVGIAVVYPKIILKAKTRPNALRVAGVEDKEKTVDWDDFEEWRAYCDKANLRVEDYTFDDKNLLKVLLVKVLLDMSKEGNALIYCDGKDKGILKVIYGLPEYLENQSDKLVLLKA